MFIKQFEPYNEDIFYYNATEKFKRTKCSIHSQLQKLELITHPYNAEAATKIIQELKSKQT